jgi:hypothetical protein
MSALRKLAAAVAVLSGAWAPAQAMDFRVDPSHPDFLMIYATGTIEADSATRFRLFLEALPPDLKRLEARGSAAVVLDSPGGLVMYAMVMAASIESHHFMTGVSDGQCLSACVLLWAAGATKFVWGHPCIGVHNATDGVAEKTDKQRKEDTYQANSTMVTWLLMHGAPHSVTAKLVATPNNELSCLTAADLAAWKVTVAPMGRRPDLTQNKRKKSAASTTTAQRQMDRGVAGALVSRQRLDHPRRPGAARRLRAQVPLKARREATTDDERLDAIAKLKGAAAGTDHCRKQRGPEFRGEVQPRSH